MKEKRNFYILIDGDSEEGFRESLSDIIEDAKEHNIICVTIPHEHSYTERKAIAEELGCEVREVSGVLMFAALREQLKHADLHIDDDQLLNMMEYIKEEIIMAIADSDHLNAIKPHSPVCIEDCIRDREDF